MDFSSSDLILISACILAGLAVWVFLKILVDHSLTTKLLSAQTGRSDHKGQIPQIGGIGIVGASLLLSGCYLYFQGEFTDVVATFMGLGLAIAVLGFLDDRFDLSASLRIIVQVVVAILLVFTTHWITGTFNAVTYLVFAILLAAYWFNAVNFMDGMDLMLVAGLSAPTLLHAFLLSDTPYSGFSVIGLLVVSALFGFAFHNKPVARVFLGDCGSLFLGLITAGLILAVSITHSPIIGVLPFLYFVVDTGTTLLFRLYRRENILLAHRSHAYQIARQRGASVWRVLGIVIFSTLLLCTLAIAGLSFETVEADLILGSAGLSLALLTVLYLRFKAFS